MKDWCTSCTMIVVCWNLIEPSLPEGDREVEGQNSSAKYQSQLCAAMLSGFSHQKLNVTPL